MSSEPTIRVKHLNGEEYPTSIPLQVRVISLLLILVVQEGQVLTASRGMSGCSPFNRAGEHRKRLGLLKIR